MTHHRLAILSLVLGLASAAVPALVWIFMIVDLLRNPLAYAGQGAFVILFILFPVALLGALAFGVPVVILTRVKALSGASAGKGGSGWSWVGVGLSAIGLLLAAGTFFGPQKLVDMIR